MNGFKKKKKKFHPRFLGGDFYTQFAAHAHNKKKEKEKEKETSSPGRFRPLRPMFPIQFFNAIKKKNEKPTQGSSLCGFLLGL